MNSIGKLSIFFLTVMYATSYVAQQEPETAAEETVEETPYEVVVRGRLTRSRLRTMIEEVEEDFYLKFNELNADDSYDIACYKHTPTMSHIWKRVCEPWFMLRARGDMASEVSFLLGHGSPSARATAIAMKENDRTIIYDQKRAYEKLQELMEEFSQSDPEFRQIGEVLAELKYRLDNYGEN